MKSRFSHCLAVVRRFEGGWSDHADDPGGATKWGISLRFLKGIGFDVTGDGAIDAYDVRAMTEEQAHDIYQDHFWLEAHCDQLPVGVDLCVFDCAVNQGPPTARRLMQKALGVKVDGIVGPKTRAAAAARDGRLLVRDYQARRALRYCRSPKVFVFGFGWFRRLLEIYALALTKEILT